MIELIFRHSWIMLIAVTTLNAAIWWRRGRETRAAHPERAASYRRLIVRMLVTGNTPWLILGGGVLFGGFILPIDPIILSEMNAWGWAFWIYIVLWTIGFVTYIFLLNGAEELSKHPGLINLPNKIQTPTFWRLISIALLAMQMIILPIIWYNKGNPNFGYDEWLFIERPNQ